MDESRYKNFYTRINQSREQRKNRFDVLMKDLNSHRMDNYNTAIGHLPGNVIAKNTFTGSYINNAITINGDPSNGSVKIEVPLIVNGRDVMKELDEMRDVLLLLRRDVDMEAKYPRLKEIKDEYERVLEKYKTFDALKESK